MKQTPNKEREREVNISDTSEPEVKDVVPASKDEDQTNALKILIVDDHAALRMILGNMVQNYSKEVLYAESGAKAVTICRNNPDIDLILMDFYMPKMSGSEAVKLIRLINKEVIIIIETADDLINVKEKSSLEGINDFFFKPFN